MAVKKYEKMTRNEKKVAIAKDVIAQILAKQLKVSAGEGYVVGSIEDDLEVLQKYLPAKEIACMMQKECTVCARGAMMLSKVAKFNNYDFDYCVDQIHTTEALKEAFTEQELVDIESCFEMSKMCSVGHNCSLDYSTIDKWASIENDEDRLLAIMQNIVDHKGTFKPKVEYEVYWK